jgi:hypothetical protein
MNDNDNGIEEMDVDDSSDDNEEPVQRQGRLQGQNNNSEHDNVQDSETEALADAFQNPKMVRILTNIPQCLSFERRIKLFHTLLQVDRLKTQDESEDMRATMLAMMRGDDRNRSRPLSINTEHRTRGLVEVGYLKNFWMT